MKCQHCLMREATFHYQSNINGQVSEQHLCAACAQQVHGPTFAAVGAGSMDLFQNLFRTPFFGHTMLGGPASRQPSSPEADLPVMPEPQEGSIPQEADGVLKQRRARNQLQAELETAIVAEDYEKAAGLRDEIYRLERAL